MAEEPGAVFFPSLPRWAGLFHLCGLLAFQLSGGGASTTLCKWGEDGASKKKRKGFEVEQITSLFEIKFSGVLTKLQDERTGCCPLLPVYRLIFIKMLALSCPHCLFSLLGCHVLGSLCLSWRWPISFHCNFRWNDKRRLLPGDNEYFIRQTPYLPGSFFCSAMQNACGRTDGRTEGAPGPFTVDPTGRAKKARV